MDEAIRIYLLEIRNMPVLTDEEERAAVRQIHATGMRFRQEALACGFVLRGAMDHMRAVCDGREPFYVHVEEGGAVHSAVRTRTRNELARMLALTEGVLRRNVDDERIIRDHRTSPSQFEAAWRRLLGRRRDAARLLAESPLRTDCLLALFDRLCDIQRSVASESRIQQSRNRRVDRVAGRRQKALVGELAGLLDRMCETPATLALRVGEVKAARQAYDAAKHVLFRGNLRLVVSIAKRYCHRGVSLLDLVQEGNLGLMRAVDKASCLFKCRFSNYAAWWITYMIQRALGDYAGPIKIPPYAVQAIARMRTVADRLSQDRGHQPNPDELAEATALPPKKLFNLMQLQRQPLRLSCYSDEGDDDPEGVDVWLLTDPRQQSAARDQSQMELHESIENALRVLPDKQQEVIRLRFGLTGRGARTLREVGQTLSLTQERIRQLEHEALDRLRTAEAGRRLADFLPGAAIGTYAGAQ